MTKLLEYLKNFLVKYKEEEVVKFTFTSEDLSEELYKKIHTLLADDGQTREEILEVLDLESINLANELDNYTPIEMANYENNLIDMENEERRLRYIKNPIIKEQKRERNIKYLNSIMVRLQQQALSIYQKKQALSKELDESITKSSATSSASSGGEFTPINVALVQDQSFLDIKLKKLPAKPAEAPTTTLEPEIATSTLPKFAEIKAKMEQATQEAIKRQERLHRPKNR